MMKVTGGPTIPTRAAAAMGAIGLITEVPS